MLIKDISTTKSKEGPKLFVRTTTRKACSQLMPMHTVLHAGCLCPVVTPWTLCLCFPVPLVSCMLCMGLWWTGCLMDPIHDISYHIVQVPEKDI
jgi:hypothetical protein